jgi:hypothetical protein
MQIQPFDRPGRAAIDNSPPLDPSRNDGNPFHGAKPEPDSGRKALIRVITSELAMLAEVTRR